MSGQFEQTLVFEVCAAGNTGTENSDSMMDLTVPLSSWLTEVGQMILGRPHFVWWYRVHTCRMDGWVSALGARRVLDVCSTCRAVRTTCSTCARRVLDVFARVWHNKSHKIGFPKTKIHIFLLFFRQSSTSPRNLPKKPFRSGNSSIQAQNSVKIGLCVWIFNTEGRTSMIKTLGNRWKIENVQVLPLQLPSETLDSVETAEWRVLPLERFRFLVIKTIDRAERMKIWAMNWNPDRWKGFSLRATPCMYVNIYI